jgi:hypothetical protein
MDYLDIKKEFRHHVLLMVGYVLIAVAIVISTLILVQQAYGFGVDRNGSVVQNGLIFFSSHPDPADIYANGKLLDKRTNTRLFIPGGIYDVILKRDGYRDWRRTVEVEGGKVHHFDYPFLFPKTLMTKPLKQYDQAPPFTTQSPDHRWLIVQPTASLLNFELYDLKNPDDPAEALTLPANLVTKAASNENWELVDWSGDNVHVLLQHNFDGKYEYVIIDREDTLKSLNLTTTLATGTSKISLRDKKYDKYYVHDTSTNSLKTASLSSTQLTTHLQRVLAYKPYGDDTLLYVTDSGATAGKVAVRLLAGSKTIDIRQLPAGTTYQVDLTKYDNVMYVVAGAASEGKAYIYRDPLGQRAAFPDRTVQTLRVLRVDQLTYLSFSATAQFIVAENGPRFGLYDIENKNGYNYSAVLALDPPQVHASWMDGHRLAYVSGGRLVVIDYDNLNQQLLMPATSGYLPAFTPNYKFVYSLATDPTTNKIALTQTPLLIPADQ